MTSNYMNFSHIRHFMLQSATVRSMPDLIETLPEIDDYFVRMEQVIKECEKREYKNGGCEGCPKERSKKCWALWNEICDLSSRGRLRWIQQGDAWHYDDQKVRDVVSQFLVVTKTKANSQPLKEPQEHFVRLEDAIMQDRAGRYKLR